VDCIAGYCINRRKLLQCVEASVLQCIEVSVLQQREARRRVLQCVAVCCGMLQRVAVCCSTGLVTGGDGKQACVPLLCSVLQ